MDLRRAHVVGALHLPLLRGVSLDLHEGEIVCLRGAPGSGKSALMRALAALDRTDGDVRWRGVDPWTLPASERSALRRRTVAWVRAGAAAAPGLAALQDVGLLGAHGASAWARLSAPASLACSERRRAVARALGTAPAALLLDDLTRGLDASEGDALARDVMDLVRAEGLALLVASDRNAFTENANRTVKLTRGRVVRAA